MLIIVYIIIVNKHLPFVMNGFTDVFEKAVKKLQIAENYSDVNTDTDINNAKSQRRIRAKKMYDFDSSTQSQSQLHHPVTVSSSMRLKYPDPPKPISTFIYFINLYCIYQLIIILLITILKYFVIFALVKNWKLLR